MTLRIPHTCEAMFFKRRRTEESNPNLHVWDRRGLHPPKKLMETLVPVTGTKNENKKMTICSLQNRHQCVPIQKLRIIQTAVPGEQKLCFLLKNLSQMTSSRCISSDERSAGKVFFQMQDGSNSRPKPSFGYSWCTGTNRWAMNLLLQREIC